ncbi:DUF4145 domain-containing protein [Catenuloplanes sp. NPDC051500]|uniref:DUF4145 domain-containing protein n=1 Tax=Catenuloplanes sp. NPDC051500 TaxID=3363959 RepID=UPI00379A1369
MEWFKGIVALVTGLAWPAVVLISVVLLKREIGRAIGRVTRFSGAGVELDFSERMEAVGAIAEAIVPDVPAELPGVVTANERVAVGDGPSLRDLLDETGRKPVNAIMRAWNLVEAGTTRLAGATGRLGTMAELRALTGSGEISMDLYELARQLRDLRNRVAHGQAVPTAAEAREFVGASWRLATELARVESR